ncbi:hypothetical protein B0T11DRAFT_269481 [Plectosphaerella cucumerina]|uniref:Uncharacterized protein n=1 Tax=Plectosphaerella cucumerina TaxID=40658 RepID=A0A8K0TNB6_9PEZI|nr:hypothetical protein B0T11DRAFT_269481 [Plectosphaerella cucumerina]
MSPFGLVKATPVRCSDVRSLTSEWWEVADEAQTQRDLILSGQASPETCCSYGTCKGDVNVSGG